MSADRLDRLRRQNARDAEKTRKTSPKSRATKTKNASFAQSLSEAAAADDVEALEPQTATEAAGDIGLLALQEKGEDTAFDQERTKKRAIAYGEGLIERLQALHVRLLSGVVSEAEFLRLEASPLTTKTEEGRRYSDEKLRSILSEIELRVQVETRLKKDDKKNRRIRKWMFQATLPNEKEVCQ